MSFTKYEFTTILSKAKIGKGTKIANYCEINGIIGKNCSIQAFVFIPDWVEIGDNVFVGPHVCFTNDKKPPSYGKYWEKTLIKKGAVIGANATILPGVIIAEKSIIGAGAVVIKSTLKGKTYIGNPAREIIKN